MRLPKSGIFIKIFLSIWLSLFILTLISVSVFILMNNDFIRVLQIKAQTEREMKNNNILWDNFNSLSNQEFIAFALNFAKEDNFRIYIFDRHKVELTGQPYPYEVQEAVDTLTKENIRASRLIHEDTITRAITLRDKFRNPSAQMPYLISLYDKNDNINAMYAWIMFYFQEIVLHLIIVSLITFFLTRHFTSPLSKLNEAADKIAEGRFENPLSGVVVRKDEMGELTAKFISMAEKLEENRQQQIRMFRDISHELRSPLTRMRLAIELARPKVDEPTSKLLQRIETEWGRMSDMINDLRIISDVTNHKPHFEQLHLGGLFGILMSDFQFEAEASDKKISLKIKDDEDIIINGNKNVLSSTFENIVRNALKYAYSEVEICLYKNETEAIIEVQDDGSGVMPENLENIFTPFFRENSDRARETGGTGLGLAIAKRGVELHNGTVTAYNIPNGFLITVRIPL